MTTKVELKIEQIARYRITGKKDREIAQLMNLSEPGLARIVALPEYKAVERRVFDSHLAAMDNQLGKRVESIRTEFRDAVPHAVAAMVDIVKQRRDLRASLSAAKEILEMDPDHALSKLSRSADPVVQNPISKATLASLTKEADALTKVNFVIAGAQAQSQSPTPEAREAISPTQPQSQGDASNAPN